MNLFIDITDKAIMMMKEKLNAVMMVIILFFIGRQISWNRPIQIRNVVFRQHASKFGDMPKSVQSCQSIQINPRSSSKHHNHQLKEQAWIFPNLRRPV